MANHTRTYSDEQYLAILPLLEAGSSLREACDACPDGPTETGVLRHVQSDSAFCAAYARARAIGWDMIADETVRIADDREKDPDANSRRLRVDTRKWLLSKRAAGTYGDKLAVTGDQGGPVEITVTWSTDTPKP